MKKNFLSKVICTGFGLGYIPRAPGTFGALGGLLVGFFIHNSALHPDFFLSVLIALSIPLGAFCANRLIPEWGNDPSKIVFDEIIGMWISILCLPNDLVLYLSAFAAFRFFDIEKPWFIRNLEKIKGGWGIMLDDVLAGIYANTVIQLLLLLKYILFKLF